ncbi:hypothetical protein HPB52_020931 [Rhipicephalus sanguineus]|uniref:Uncharacterized protein n=1 Tax=Rhipicephalus sanguineus TaxID=34632 RepID=A0A9D4Q2I0_RHISA|nr:hypothetical protein HPB52_020931 [Rhipicephalus sanguineus]
MVCIPCIVAPVLLFIWYRFIQPIVLSIWNPWAKKEISVNAAGDASDKEKSNNTAKEGAAGVAEPAQVASSPSEPPEGAGVSKKTD